MNPSKKSRWTTDFPILAHLFPPSGKIRHAAQHLSQKNSSFPQEGAGQERQEDLNSNYLYTLAKYLPPLNGPKSENSIPVSQNFSEEKIDLSGSTSSEKGYLTHNFRK